MHTYSVTFLEEDIHVYETTSVVFKNFQTQSVLWQSNRDKANFQPLELFKEDECDMLVQPLKLRNQALTAILQ